MAVVQISNADPIRVLQVIGGMDRGEVATWLMHVLRNIDRGRYRMDFLVHVETEGYYDREIRERGSRIFRCPHTSNPYAYAQRFSSILSQHGPYDVVHGHVHRFSGLVMKVANKAGVPTRVTHSHMDTAALDRKASLARFCYLETTGRWISSYSTAMLAASEHAASSLFGKYWWGDPRISLAPCGLDLRPFLGPVDRQAVRAEFGIGPDEIVLGHLGGFYEHKNHRFLLQLGSELMRENPAIRLLLVGEGGLRLEMENLARELGMREKTTFAGERDDAARVISGAMDVLVFPSSYEGLGLGVVEAQAAGIPSVLSDGVPATTIWREKLVHRVRGFDLQSWMEAVKQQMDTPRAAPDAGGPFAIGHSMQLLEAVYSRQPREYKAERKSA